MVVTQKKVIWQPVAIYQPSMEFGILLDRDFSKDMLESKTTQENQDRLQKLANEYIMKRFKLIHLNPYIFREDSCFVKQIHLGSNGKWLCVDTTYDRIPTDVHKGLIPYLSHNIDNSIDAYGLIALVDMWVTYSKILKEE